MLVYIYDNWKGSLIMEKIIKSIVKSSIFTSGILILLGLLLFIKSDDTIVAISYLVGGAIIILGILAFINFFKKKNSDFVSSFDIIYGMITVVFGIFILSNPKMVATIIPFIIGGWVLIKSSFKIAYAIELKNVENVIWKNVLVTSIISALVGVIMIFNPFKTSVVVFKIIGAAIIVYAILDIISTIQLKKNVDEFSEKVGNSSMISDEEDTTIVDAEIEEIDKKTTAKSKKGKKKNAE